LGIDVIAMKKSVFLIDYNHPKAMAEFRALPAEMTFLPVISGCTKAEAVGGFAVIWDLGHRSLP
jgi:hypothetical protein